MRKKIFGMIFTVCFLVSLTGCTEQIVTIEPSSNEENIEEITYEAMLYDNQGNNYLNFYGSKFNISPNKVKQYGYDTSGSWISYFETSSVVTVEIDGSYIETCGSTVIFKDKRLEMLEIPDELNTVNETNGDGYSVSEDGQNLDTYLGLRHWWYDAKEKGQHGKKIVLIQSQDGYNIGAFTGDEVTWEVAGKLPKTTKIMVDGLPLYIHRCNFTIIDAALMDNSLESEG